MNTIANFYPLLSERSPLPFYYTTACLGLSLLPFLSENKRLTSLVIFPILLYLCAQWPRYTTGDPSSDYYNNSQFIAIPLWFLDFALLTPRDGDESPVFLGRRVDSAAVKPRNENDGAGVKSQRRQDLTTFTQRLKWAFRLMLPAQRGIGWNWQVKGVPADHDASLPKWHYVRRKAWWTLLYYAQSVVALTVLGLGLELRGQLRPEQRVERRLASALVGWAGAVWVWDRLCCAYSLAAALAVAVGLSETWEWPPLMGRLGDAWSVRQMWSATYHQACRRLLSQPARRLTTLLGLSKGSTASSYAQLFISFGISCVFHQAQMFNVTRKDMGELAFFMSQPLAIVAEDLVCHLWKRSNMSTKSGRFERVMGYIWTVAWFSSSLQIYISGLVDAQVIQDWIFGYKPLDKGAELGRQLLRG